MNFNHATVAAINLTASLDFYRLLGFKLIVSSEHYARFELPGGDATFSIELSPNVAQESAPVLYFECDVDAEHARLSAAGVAFDSAPETKRWLWREAELRDPFGNRIKLYHAGAMRRHPPWRLPDDPGDAACHIVITDEAELYLVKRPGADWRALQDEFPTYTTSLGPYDIHAVMDMVEAEWPDIFAARAADIAAFNASADTTLKL